MLLQNKVAVIHGAGGSVAGTAARMFASEGATVFLAGRSEAPLQQVADEIRRVRESGAVWMYYDRIRQDI